MVVSEDESDDGNNDETPPPSGISPYGGNESTTDSAQSIPADAASAERTLDLTTVDEDVGEVSISTDLMAAVESEESAVEVLVHGAHTTTTVARKTTEGTEHLSETKDLSQFAGQEVTVEVRTQADARAEVDQIEVERDSTGDGMRDVVKQATQDQEIVIDYVADDGDGNLQLRSEPVRLDSYDSDTNGDGLSDDQQVSFDVQTVHSPWSGDVGYEVDFDWYRAHPNKETTDGSGLTDAEEIERGSNPLESEELRISVSVPTRVENEDDSTPWEKEEGYYDLAILQSFTPDYDKGDRTYWRPDICLGCQDPPDALRDGSGTDHLWCCDFKDGVDWEAGDLMIVVPINVVVEQNANEEYPAVESIEFSAPESEENVSMMVDGRVELDGEGAETTYIAIKITDPDLKVNNEKQTLRELGPIHADVSFEENSPYARDSGNRVETNEYTIDWIWAYDNENLLDTTANTLKDGVSYAFGFGTFSAIGQGSRLVLYEGGKRAYAKYVVANVGGEAAGPAVERGVEYYEEDIVKVDGDSSALEYTIYYNDVGYMMVREN